MKSKLFFQVILLAILCICSIAFAQEPPTHEEISLTTYYPAPYGEYNSLSVGDPTAGYTATSPGVLLVEDKVGIGTAPDIVRAKLDVRDGHVQVLSEGTGNYGLLLYKYSSDAAYYRGVVDFMRARGSMALPAAVSAGDYIMSIEGVGFDGSIWDYAGGIHMKSAGVSGGVVESEIHFDTANQAVGTGRTVMTINKDGNVGIGTTGPEGTLHVHTGSAGAVTAHITASDLVLEESGNAGMSILSGITGSIYFGDADDNNVGAMYYIHGNDNMIFRTNAAIRMVIDDAGNVGIGTTGPAQKLDVSGDYAIDGNRIISGYYSGTTSAQYSNGVWFNLFNSATVGTGTFLVEVGPLNTYQHGGAMYGEVAVFLVRVHQGTNSGQVTAIPSTFGGHAPNNRTMSFQLLRTPKADGKSYVQMKVDGESLASAEDINWKAVRMF